MNLFLLRHGIAADYGSPLYKKDSDRPLTDEGEQKMAGIVQAMEKMGILPDIILSSPYVRTRQTAEIAAKHLRLTKQLKFSDHLASEGGDPKKIIAEIHKDYATAENVMLVGHEPYLSSLISVLVTGTAEAEFTMKKGGLCKLSVFNLQYKKCACLEWLLTPKQMIAMAGS